MSKPQGKIERDRVYTLDEAAKLLGTTKTTLYNEIERNKLPRTKVGKNYRILGEVLQSYLGSPSVARMQSNSHLDSTGSGHQFSVDLVSRKNPDTDCYRPRVMLWDNEGFQVTSKQLWWDREFDTLEEANKYASVQTAQFIIRRQLLGNKAETAKEFTSKHDDNGCPIAVGDLVTLAIPRKENPDMVIFEVIKSAEGEFSIRKYSGDALTDGDPNYQQELHNQVFQVVGTVDLGVIKDLLTWPLPRVDMKQTRQ